MEQHSARYNKLGELTGTKVVSDPRLLPKSTYPVVALGNFDGVHLGHQTILGAAVKHARLHGGLAFAVTFDPPPAKVLSPEQAPKAIMTLEDKLFYLSRFGLDAIVVLHFDRYLSQLSPRQFVENFLVEPINVRKVVIGATAAFGHNRSGNARVMVELGREFGFEVFVVEPVKVNGVQVSSSKIRELILCGDVKSAATMLGRPHFLSGKVIKGRGRGRQLGFPTINLESFTECVPANGVYAGRVAWNGKLYDAIVNIGVRPTFNESERAIEAHLFDFNGDLYEQRIRIQLIENVREERKFPSAAELAAQIARDIVQARTILSGVPKTDI